MRGTPASPRPPQQPIEVRPNPQPPFGAWEEAGPGVEDLDRVGAGPVLAEEVTGAEPSQAVEQGVESRRLLVGERPQPREVAHAATLDQVGREGQRSAREAEQCRLQDELGPHDPLGGRDLRGDRGLVEVVGIGQGGDVPRAADRLSDHRPRIKTEVDTEGRHG